VQAGRLQPLLLQGRQMRRQGLKRTGCHGCDVRDGLAHEGTHCRLHRQLLCCHRTGTRQHCSGILEAGHFLLQGNVVQYGTSPGAC
jgi:hypothetical protein